MDEGKKRNKNGSIFSECFDRLYWEVKESGKKKGKAKDEEVDMKEKWMKGRNKEMMDRCFAIYD